MMICAVCEMESTVRPINAQWWVVDTEEPQFGGHYERRDFCSMACVKLAPKYRTARKVRVQKTMLLGEWGQACMLANPKVKR